MVLKATISKIITFTDTTREINAFYRQNKQENNNVDSRKEEMIFTPTDNTRPGIKLILQSNIIRQLVPFFLNNILILIL